MVRLLKTSIGLTGGLFFALSLACAQAESQTFAQPEIPTYGPPQSQTYASPETARPDTQFGSPGIVNYVEGQASLDGQPIARGEIGQLSVAPGHVLSTADGKAEMLLTPGVFLRLDSHSAVKMVSPSLTKTTVELLQGKAMVEADQLEKENHLVMLDHGASIMMEKHGIYEFNADPPMVAVYDGKVKVQQDDRTKDVFKGEKLLLALDQNPKLKTQSLNRKQEDDLYAWSKLRSEYTSEANMASARTIVMENPWWWYGTGWYWNPWFDSWAFVPGGGFLYSPFGFGFYSPAYYGGFYGRGFYGPSRFGYGGRGVAGAFRGPMAAGGFRGGMGGFRGGMGGGFHGGGFGGRR